MKKVVRLMNGLEKTSEDCYAHALYLREEDDCAVVVMDDGVIHHWPKGMVVDDATDEEEAEFYIAHCCYRRQS